MYQWFERMRGSSASLPHRQIHSAAHTFEQQLYEATRLRHRGKSAQGKHERGIDQREFFGRGLLFPTFNAGIPDLERLSQEILYQCS
jgi:hypothetical protein